MDLIPRRLWARAIHTTSHIARPLAGAIESQRLLGNGRDLLARREQTFIEQRGNAVNEAPRSRKRPFAAKGSQSVTATPNPIQKDDKSQDRKISSKVIAVPQPTYREQIYSCGNVLPFYLAHQSVLYGQPKQRDHGREMELVFLGTGSGHEDKRRSSSAACLRYCKTGHTYLFDSGDGVLRQLTTCNVPTRTIRRIFITHLHLDHIMGLPGLIAFFGLPDKFQERDIPKLDIYGPPGLYKFLLPMLRLAHRFHEHLTIHEFVTFKQSSRLNSEERSMKSQSQSQGLKHQLKYIAPAGKLENGQSFWEICPDDPQENVTIKVSRVRHTVQTFGYVVEEHSRPGILNKEEIMRRGVQPGPVYAKLKNGESVIAPDGTEVRSEDVVGPRIPGRKVVILGDTCDASPMLDLVKGADVLVHEVTFDAMNAHKARASMHSTPYEAAKFANAAKVKHLIITHHSPRYRPNEVNNIQDLVKSTAAYLHPDISLISAVDLLAIPIPTPEAKEIKTKIAIA